MMPLVLVLDLGYTTLDLVNSLRDLGIFCVRTIRIFRQSFQVKNPLRYRKSLSIESGMSSYSEDEVSDFEQKKDLQNQPELLQGGLKKDPTTVWRCEVFGNNC